MTLSMEAAPPLLRSPPFPNIDATVSHACAGACFVPPDDTDIDRLLASVKSTRVGGRFWAPAARATGAVIIRPRIVSEIPPMLALLDEAERASAIWLLPKAVDRARVPAGFGVTLADDVDPWSLLVEGVQLFAHGDDEWSALAHIAGCRVRFLSAGRFGAPDAGTALVRRAVVEALLDVRYRNPFTGQDAAIEATIAQLAEWRTTFSGNRVIVAACGIAWWKRPEIARFLWTPERPLRIFRSERRAIAHAKRTRGAVAVWPSRISAGMVAAARSQGVPLVRVEDGFIRSVGLGSNLVPPSSVAVDRLGIHYDPTAPSDLETLLAEAVFPHALLARAEQLHQTILAAGISKYGRDTDRATPSRQPGRRLILVPGQVEDDMSVRLGGGGLSSNLDLLRRVRALEPDAEIWFRPHPDVDAGHRKGTVGDVEALVHADRIVRGGGMAPLLETVDAVHVLTSLTGFEALLRGRAVACHGTPFYAGWGLTQDLAEVPARRGRTLTITQLIAAVLILYPRYLDPVTGLPCPPEMLIERMAEGAARNRLGWITGLRRLQGRLSGTPR